VLLGTPLVADLVRRGDIHGIKEVMEKSENLGMQTFDSALFRLYESGRITMEEALRNADSHNNLRLRINLSQGKVANDDEFSNASGGNNNGENGGLSLSLD